MIVVGDEKKKSSVDFANSPAPGEPPRTDLTIPWKRVLGAAAVACALLVIAWHFVFEWNWAQTGAFGDSVAPLVGVLTAVALLLTVWQTRLQRDDIAIQRNDLRAQLQEMRESRVQLEEQSKRMGALATAQEQANTIQKENMMVDGLLARAQLLSAQAQSRATRIAGLSEQIKGTAERNRHVASGLGDRLAELDQALQNELDGIDDDQEQVRELLANVDQIARARPATAEEQVATLGLFWNWLKRFGEGPRAREEE